MKRILFLFLVLLTNVFIFDAEASYHQDAPDYNDFMPVIYYEEDTERHREFSISYDFDDNNVENNRENYRVDANDIGLRSGNQGSAIYVHGGKSPSYEVKLLDKDKDGDPFWVIEYHYYSARNTYYHWQTHEHDWEWVYVIVIEDKDGYTPLLASSGSHDLDRNHGSFGDWKYGRYSDNPKYLKFTQGGLFGLLEKHSGDRARFYVGNDGNGRYGTTQNLKSIESWRCVDNPFPWFPPIVGRNSIENTLAPVINFHTIPMPTTGLSPNVFFMGDGENVISTGIDAIDTRVDFLFSQNDGWDPLSAPWNNNDWNHPFPNDIDVPDVIPPIVKKVTITQDGKGKYWGEWIEKIKTVGPNNVEVVVSRTWLETPKRKPCNVNAPIEIKIEFSEDMFNDGVAPEMIEVTFGEDAPYANYKFDGGWTDNYTWKGSSDPLNNADGEYTISIYTHDKGANPDGFNKKKDGNLLDGNPETVVGIINKARGNYDDENKVDNNKGGADQNHKFLIDTTPPTAETVILGDQEYQARDKKTDDEIEVDIGKIEIIFSEEMDPGSLPWAKWPIDISPYVRGIYDWSSDRKTLTFTPFGIPFGLLEESTSYTITIPGALTDLVGSFLDGNYDGESDGSEDYTFRFRTRGPPKVTSTFPANGSKIDVDFSVIRVHFSEDIDQKSSSNPLRISPSIKGSANWSDNNTFTLTPSELLQEGKEYELTVSGSLTDLAGDHLDGNRFDKGSPSNANGSDDYLFRFETRNIPPTSIFTDVDVQPKETETVILLDCRDREISRRTRTIQQGKASFKWTGQDNRTSPSKLKYAYGLGSPGGFSSATSKSYVLSPGTYTFYLQAKDEAGNVEEPPRSRKFTISESTRTKTKKVRSPGCDHPDEKVDISEPNYEDLIEVDLDSDILILNSGWAHATASLLTNLKETFNLRDPTASLDLFTPYKILIIPTGGLADISESNFIKATLEEYVKNGGTIISFAQPHGDDFKVLPRADELKTYGWKQDISCHNNSVYIYNHHPIFAGQLQEKLNLNVDGYFTSWPDEARILLARTKNDWPAMLSYPYGKGLVIASTLYSDWSYLHGQISWGHWTGSSTSDEINLIRDMLSFVKDPMGEIPDYREGEEVNLQLTIYNYQLAIAEKIEIKLYDPDKNELISDTQELAPPLEPGQSATIPFNWTAQEKTGIYWIHCNLLNGQGEIIQKESKRFSISLPYSSMDPDPDLLLTIDGPEEPPVRDEKVTFTITIYNRTNEDKSGLAFWASSPTWNAGQREIPMGSFKVGPFQTTSLECTTNRIYFDWGSSWNFYAWLYDEEGKKYGGFAKTGLVGRWLRPSINLSIRTDKEQYQRGEDLRISVDIEGEIPIGSLGNLKVNVSSEDFGDTFQEKVLEVSFPSREKVTKEFIYLLPESLWGGEYTINADFYGDGLRGHGMSTFNLDPPYKLSLSIEAKEHYARGTDAEFKFTIKNEGAADRELTLKGSFHGWSPPYQPFEKTLFVPAGEKTTYSHTLKGVHWGSTLYASLYNENGKEVERTEKEFYVCLPASYTLRLSLELDKEKYLRGEEVKAVLNLKDKYEMDYPAKVRVELDLEADTTPILDEEIELIDGKATKEFTYLLPEDAKSGPYSIEAKIYYQNEQIGHISTSFEVPKPELGVSLILPDAFSQTNTVSFEIENVGVIYTLGGKLGISLEHRALSSEKKEEIWRGEKEFGRLEVGDTTTLDFDLPIEEIRFGTYLLSYHLQYETEEIKGEIEIPSSMAVELDFDKPSYRVREEMGLELKVTNAGDFGETVGIRCQASGIRWEGGEESVILLPKESRTFNYTTTIPEDVYPGRHEVEVVIGHRSSVIGNQGDSMTKRFAFFIPESDLRLSLDRREYSCGEEINIGVSNTGGVDAAYSYQLRLTDQECLPVGEDVGQGAVRADQVDTITYTLGGDLVSGGYNLRVDLKDEKKGKTLICQFYLEVDGLMAKVFPESDKLAYSYGEEVKVKTLIENLGPSISGATLKLKAYTIGGEYGLEVYPGVKNVSSIGHDGDFIWFGTNGEGVFRYSKASGDWLHLDISNSALPSNNILSIGVDSSLIYFGTDEGLSIYSKSDGSFRNIPEIDGQNLWAVDDISVGQDFIWLTGAGRPYRYNKATDKWESLLARIGWVNTLTLSEDGSLVITKSNVVYTYDDAEGLKEIGSIWESIYWIATDGSDIWISGQTIDEGNCLFYYNMNEQSLNHLPIPQDILDLDPVERGDYISTITVDGQRLLLGSSWGGLVRYDKMSKTYKKLVSESGGVLENVEVMATDSDYLWLGGWQAIIRYDKKAILEDRYSLDDKELIWYAFMGGGAMMDGTPLGIHVENDHLWILAHQSGELIRFDKDNKTFTSLGNCPARQISSSTNDGDFIWAAGSQIFVYDKLNNTWIEKFPSWLFEGVGFEDGYLWFSSDEMAIRYDRARDTFRTYQEIPVGINLEPLWEHWDLEVNQRWILGDLFESLNLGSAGGGDGGFSSPFNSTVVDTGSLWFGGDNGLWQYLKAGDEFKIALKKDRMIQKMAGQLDSAYLYLLIDAGLYRYQKSTEELIWLTDLQARVSSILVDHNIIWLGTDEGVLRYEDGALTIYNSLNTDGGLLDDHILSMALDEEGLVWFGTEWGVSSYNKATEAWTAYEGRDVKALLVDQDLIWIGGTGKLLCYQKMGTGKKILFEQEMPVDVETNLIKESDLGTPDALGKVYLEAELISSAGQEIAKGKNHFYIYKSHLFLTLETDQEIYKPGETITITTTIYNHDSVPTIPLTFILEKKGEEIIYQEEGIVIDANGQRTFSLTTGDSSSFILEAALGQLKLVDFVEVAEPELEVEIEAPEVVGREEFRINILLRNTGRVETVHSLQFTVHSQEGETIYQSPITSYQLKPGEMKIFEERLAIGQDVVLKVEITGDVNKTVTKEIRFGEDLDIEVSPKEVYPVGIVRIPFVITNSGSLDSEVEVAFTLEKKATGNRAPGYKSTRAQEHQALIASYHSPVTNNQSPITSYQLPDWCRSKPEIRIRGQEAEGRGQEAEGRGQRAEGREQKSEGRVQKAVSPVTNNQLPVTSYQLSSSPDKIELTKVFYLPVGERIEGELVFDLGEGSYNLEWVIGNRSSVIGEEKTGFRVAKDNIVEITSLLVHGPQSIVNGKLPVDVSLKNIGGNKFLGNLGLKTSFYEEEIKVELNSGQEDTYTFRLPLIASAGTYTVKAEVLHNGKVIAEKEQEFTLSPKFEITRIQGLKDQDVMEEGQINFDLGQEGRLRFAIKNTGTAEGEAVLHLEFLDLVDEERRFWLGVGQEEEIKFDFQIPDDLEDKDYIAEYVVHSPQSTVHSQGEAVCHINGVKIGLKAELDKLFYEEGDTAALTISITNLSTLSGTMYAKANFNEYEGAKSFELGAKSQKELSFEIPVAFTGQKIGYGIYMGSGRSIYLNSIYIREMGELINLRTDKEVYKAGEEVRINYQLSINNDQLDTGDYRLEIEVPGIGEPFAIFLAETEGKTGFLLPEGLTSGTYLINYQLTINNDQLLEEGEYRFDVIGYMVKILEATLDNEVYTKGDTLSFSLLLDSNKALTALFKGWAYDPEGEYAELFSQTEELPVGRRRLEFGGQLKSTLLGVHQLIYALYLEDEEGLFLAAGTKSFDLGSLAMDSLKTDRSTYYTKGPIILTVKTIGQGEANLSLLLDDLPFRDEGKMDFDQEKSLEQTLEILKAGEHKIKVRLKTGDLISEKEVLVNMVDTQPPTTGLQMSDSCWADRRQKSEGRSQKTPSPADNHREIIALTENSYAFSAQDNFGVEQIEVRLDSGPFRPCTAPISIKEEGEHLLIYHALDVNGNIEEDKELKVFVDISPPKIIRSFPSNGSYLRKDDLSLLKLIFSEEIEMEGGISLWENKRGDRGIPIKNLRCDSGTNRILFGLAESLEDNHEYRIEIGQGIRDLIGHVLPGQTITFYTLTRKEIGGVVRKDSACVSVPPDALPEDAYLRIEPSGKDPASSIPNSTFDYTAVNDKEEPMTLFNGNLTLEISYPDKENDGLVDGTEIDENSLQMFYLNEEQGKWQGISASKVNPDSNIVLAEVNHLSTFCLMSSPEVVAAFKADFKNEGLPLTVCFTDISIGTITHRIWDFENDGRFIGTESSPCHTYTEPGRHTAKLIVIGPDDSDFVKMTFEVTEKVEADFTGSPLSGCLPLTVQFEDISTGTITSRRWDFGDGDTSTRTNPIHTYNKPGIYSVTLSVHGEEISDSKTRSSYITVLDQVKAGFSLSPASGLAPLEIVFSDSSTGNIQNYLWDFGDGQTSPDPSPSHLYTDPSTYRVCLTVSGECTTDAREVLIKVNSAKWETFNYPNPFNPVDGKEATAPDGTATDGTIIKYTLPEDTDDEVLVHIYDISGEPVRKFNLSSGEYRSRGDHYIGWDGRNDGGRMTASGVYIYYIKAGRYKSTHKMAVIK